MLLNIPNMLTLGRIMVIPVILGLLCVPGHVANFCALAIFIGACLTDYLDGYFARLWNLDSHFGRFLDPMADKLLVASILLLLTALDRISGIHILPALVILCREILVSGLRACLAELHASVPVSRLAKWKTTIQMIALGFLLVSPEALHPITHIVGLTGLWISAALTVMTGLDYWKASAQHFTS